MGDEGLYMLLNSIAVLSLSRPALGISLTRYRKEKQLKNTITLFQISYCVFTNAYAWSSVICVMDADTIVSYKLNHIKQ